LFYGKNRQPQARAIRGHIFAERFVFPVNGQERYPRESQIYVNFIFIFRYLLRFRIRYYNFIFAFRFIRVCHDYFVVLYFKIHPLCFGDGNIKKIIGNYLKAVFSGRQGNFNKKIGGKFLQYFFVFSIFLFFYYYFIARGVVVPDPCQSLDKRGFRGLRP